MKYKAKYFLNGRCWPTDPSEDPLAVFLGACFVILAGYFIYLIAFCST